MRRKVVMHGPSSLSVSLPSDWAKKHDIKKGDEVDIEEAENSLMISASGKSGSEKTLELSFDGLNNGARMDLLLALHKKGYDEIKIMYEKPDIIRDIYRYLNTMHLGYEIVQQEAKFALIKNVSIPEEEKFDSLYRRVFRICIEYSYKIKAILDNKDMTMTETVLLHPESIRRISGYCKRLVIAEKIQNSAFIYHIIECLESISLNLTGILEAAREGVDGQTRLSYTETCRLLEAIHQLHYKFSLQDYDAAKRELEKAMDRNIQPNGQRDALCWMHMHEMQNSLHGILRQILAMQY